MLITTLVSLGRARQFECFECGMVSRECNGHSTVMFSHAGATALEDWKS